MALASLKLFNVVRLRFHWQIVTRLTLPDYAGSTLRGVFGHALKRQNCLTGAHTCQGCSVIKQCPYPAIFEPQAGSQSIQKPPQVIKFSIESNFHTHKQNHSYQPGEHYCFDMVLMTSDIIKQLPLIIAAWKNAFTRGVGPGSGQAQLFCIEQQHTNAEYRPYYSAVDGSKQTIQHKLIIPEYTQPDDITIQWLTPLRIQHKGQLIKAKQLTPAIFLRHLIRRVSFLLSHTQPSVLTTKDIHHLNELADTVKNHHKIMHWQDWQRHSSRQRRKIKLGGLMGYWKIKEVPPQLLSLIYLGQWLHVGKQIAFGFGHYQWSASLPEKPTTEI